jgi:hypothetical protein
MFRARSRRAVVSSLQLWQFMETEVRGSRARRIPLTWILILDLLIAALITLALADPTWAREQQITESRHQVLVLDTSTSMLAQDRFTEARRDLRQELVQLGPTDAATVILSGPTAQVLGDSRKQDLSEVLTALDLVQPGHANSDLTAALALAEASLDPILTPQIQVYTDAAFDDWLLPSGFPEVSWQTYGQPTDNQAVLALETRSLSNQKLQVFARFVNFGQTAVSRPASLFLDGQSAGSVTIDLEPNSTRPYTWDVFSPQPPNTVSVLLEGEDDLAADDVASLGQSQTGVLRVALVSDDPDPLDRAIQVAPDTELTYINPADYIPASPFDLVVFRGFLPDRWPGGSVLVVEPPAGSELLASAALRPVTSLPVPRPDPLLNDVDFSGVRWSEVWDVGPLPDGLEPILSSAERPLIARGRIGLTEVILLLPDLNGGNFTRHPVFPVLIANVIAAAGDGTLSGQAVVGAALELPDPEAFPMIQIQPPEGETIVLDSSRAPTWAGAQTVGIYVLTLTDLNGAERLAYLGVNAGDVAESNLLRQAELVRRPDSAGTTRSETVDVSLQPWLLAAAVVLLMVEAYLAWRPV